MKLKLGVITALSVMCVSVGAAYAGDAAEPKTALNSRLRMRI